MSITSPTKEPPSALPSVDNHYTPSENGSDSDEDEDQDDDLESMTESEAEEEEEDPLGDEQCKAIMENYILETSTRTNLLRNRIQTHFRPALRRRLDFELSRITPSIAHVTALDYHQRDQGILRHTMEYVARLTIEEKSLFIGMKRSQSQQEQIWDEIERHHHHKRKRQLTINTGSISSQSSRQNIEQHPPSSPTSATATNQSGRHPSRSKPPTSRSTQGGGGQHRKPVSFSSLEPTELNPRLPSTPLMSELKPARLARRNESLLSVNGSPVISYGPDDAHQALTTTTSSNTIASSKFSELFPTTNSTTSLNDDPLRSTGGGGGGSSSTSHHALNGLNNSNNQFTFVAKSRWKELENQLNSLQIDQSQRKKLDELLKGCLSFGDS